MRTGRSELIIDLDRGEEWYRDRWYRRMRFASEGGRIRFERIKFVYMNGYTETEDIDPSIGEREVFDLRLRGRRSYLRTIVLTYRARSAASYGRNRIRLSSPRIRVYARK